MSIPARYENGLSAHVPAGPEPARKRPSITDLPFYGMWKDRTDIGDGIDYVNRLRDHPVQQPEAERVCSDGNTKARRMHEFATKFAEGMARGSRSSDHSELYGDDGLPV